MGRSGGTGILIRLPAVAAAAALRPLRLGEETAAPPVGAGAADGGLPAAGLRRGFGVADGCKSHSPGGGAELAAELWDRMGRLYRHRGNTGTRQPSRLAAHLSAGRVFPEQFDGRRGQQLLHLELPGRAGKDALAQMLLAAGDADGRSLRDGCRYRRFIDAGYHLGASRGPIPTR